MRLGIFGGTFDPVHYGHLLLAEACREACGLSEVWFLPAAVPPHKQSAPLTPAKQRIEMLELAIAGHESFRISTIEIDRGGVSYTVETLQAVRAAQPAAELFLLMGGDSLRDLPTWREPARICELALPVVMRRVGSPEPDFEILRDIIPAERIQAAQQQQVEIPLVELSSTDIRDRAATGRSIRFRTPRAVEQYIVQNRLYVR